MLLLANHVEQHYIEKCNTVVGMLLGEQCCNACHECHGSGGVDDFACLVA